MRCQPPPVLSLLIDRAGLQFVHFGFRDLLLPVPFCLLGAPLAKPLGGEHQFPLAHAPVNAPIHLPHHSWHPSVVPIHREVKMMRFAFLASETNEPACVLRVLREPQSKVLLHWREFDGHGCAVSIACGIISL